MAETKSIPESTADFNIWDYPVFAILLGYIWFELINPEVGAALQIIPKIPNSAIATILCYFSIPEMIKKIAVPFSLVKWVLPFMLLATFNLPFIQYAKSASLVEVISTWFWVLMLPPIMIRVLSTRSGRSHFAMFSIASVVVICLQYYYHLNENIGFINRGNMAIGVVSVLPILVGYLYISEGIKRYYLLISLAIIMLAIIPAGSRSSWLIMPIELILLMLFVLPKARFMFSSMIIGISLLVVFSFLDIGDIYSSEALSHFETRLRKAREWEEDNTIWKRAGMIVKTKEILTQAPLMGIGYSNRSFAEFEGGDIEFMGRLAKVRRIDAHNTYLNILGGTGILGFLAFLYFLYKVFTKFRVLNSEVWRNLDAGPFIVSVIGTFLRYGVNTQNFSHIVYTTSLILALYVMRYNELLEELEIQDHTA